MLRFLKTIEKVYRKVIDKRKNNLKSFYFSLISLISYIVLITIFII